MILTNHRVGAVGLRLRLSCRDPRAPATRADEAQFTHQPPDAAARQAKAFTCAS